MDWEFSPVSMTTSLKSMGKGWEALLFPVPLGRTSKRSPSISSPEVSSSEFLALWGTLFVPRLNNPSFVFALFLLDGPTRRIWSSVTARTEIESTILFFFEIGRGLYPAASYKSGNAFLNLSLKSVDRRFCSWKMGSLTIWAQSVPCFSYPARNA